MFWRVFLTFLIVFLSISYFQFFWDQKPHLSESVKNFSLTVWNKAHHECSMWSWRDGSYCNCLVLWWFHILNHQLYPCQTQSCLQFLLWCWLFSSVCHLGETAKINEVDAFSSFSCSSFWFLFHLFYCSVIWHMRTHDGSIFYPY